MSGRQLTVAVALVAVVWLPLSSALREVTWEVRTRASVQRIIHGLPLAQAAVCGHEEVVKLLLDGGGEVDAADNEGWTPLHKAAADGHLPVVKLLLAAGANREAQNARKQTPAMLAKQRKNADVVEALSP